MFDDELQRPIRSASRIAFPRSVTSGPAAHISPPLAIRQDTATAVRKRVMNPGYDFSAGAREPFLVRRRAIAGLTPWYLPRRFFRLAASLPVREFPHQPRPLMNLE